MKPQRLMARVGGAIGIAAFGLVPTSLGQECPEDIGSLNTEKYWSGPTRIEVSGSNAYLLQRGRYLNCKGGGYSQELVYIVDVSDPDQPLVTGRFWAGGPSVDDFSVSGDRYFDISTYCRETASWQALNIIDLSDPDHPSSLLYHRIDGRAWGLEVSEDEVFITTSDGLIVLDVTDPTNPLVQGFFASQWEPSDLAVESGHAYVTVPDSGLRIIDVSDPTNPSEAGRLAKVWEAHDVEVSSGFAYVADGAGGLRVIDVTDPENPTEVGILESDIDVMNVAVDGSLATVGLAHPGVLVVDVSDPAMPTRKDMFMTEGPAEDTALRGKTALTVTGPSDSSDVGGFRVLDLSVPDQTIERASFAFQSSATDIAVSNAVKYITVGDSGLYVLDESDPDEPVEEFLDTPGFAVSVTLHEQYALVADDHKGVRIINVSDTRNLVEVGFVDTPGQARSVAVLGDFAYVADGDGGLRIIDISTPTTPAEIGAVDTPEPAIDVAVEGDYAYVAASYLRIFDISDPVNPVAVDTSEPIYVRTLTIENQLLYLVGNHFQIFGLSNPSEPQLLVERRYSTYLANDSMDITISGHHAYVSTSRNHWGYGGVKVFDILNPRSPSKVGEWEFDGDAWGVYVSNDRVYLAAGCGGVVILDNRCLTTYWMAIAAHNSGFRGSEWRSDVIISHEAGRPVGVEFLLHTFDGVFTADAFVDPEQQAVFEDIVGILGYEGQGALEIQADHPISITGRMYSETDPGTYGAFLQGYRSSECFGSGKLYGLRQVEGEFRTNISVTNTTSEAHDVWISLYRTDGTELFSYPIHVEPKVVVQDLQPFKHRAGQPNLGWGYAIVEGEEGILACASVIDSRTNDALIVPLFR